MLSKSIGDSAEMAIRAIQTRTVGYLAAQGNDVGTVGRCAFRFREEVKNREVIATIVGVVEEFVTALLVELHSEIPYTQVSSWPKRIAAWLQHEEIDLRVQCASFTKFEGFVAARNAILHNRGSLTDMQLDGNRKQASYGKLYDDLRRAGILYFGRDLVIQVDTVLNCVDCCLGVICELDSLVRSSEGG